MTLEGEILADVGVIDVLNGDTSFDRSDSETSFIRKAGNTTSLKLEWRLHAFELDDRISEIVDDDISIGRANHSQFVLNGGAVGTFWELYCRDGAA